MVISVGGDGDSNGVMVTVMVLWCYGDSNGVMVLVMIVMDGV